MAHKRDLGEKKCADCEGAPKALTQEQAREFARQLDPHWTIEDQRKLRREFRFKNFREALEFTNRVGELAEREGHHPDLQLGWGYVTVLLWTHSTNGLTESDFILAAKIDGLS